MQSESKRIFVPNLPEGLTEEDVRHRFFKFGDITSIEIKHRKELNARNDSHRYAFINIDTNHQLLQQCFNEFTNKKWSGHYVDVQLAKESFLERLKREREDAQIQKNETRCNGQTLEIKADEICVVSHSNKKRFIVDEEERTTPKKSKVDKTSKLDIATNSKSSCKNLKRDEVKVVREESLVTLSSYEEDSDLVVKSNKHKGITNKIDSVGLAPIHIQKKEVRRKSKDPHREKADQKRISAMLRMKQGYMQQKSAIKNALLDIDGRKNKKIVFNDDNASVAVNNSTIENNKKGKLDHNENGKFALFDADDDSNAMVEETTFKLREEYEGKKGKKLFEMQTRFNQDDRFKMDARFAEEDVSDCPDKTTSSVDQTHADERAMQLQLLAEVLKKPVPPSSQPRLRKSMLRFDPSQPEHSKYELPAPQESSSKQSKAKYGDNDKQCALQEKLPEVSSETFYQVSEKIPFLENGGGEVFSFLKAFGRDSAEVSGEANHTSAQKEQDTDDHTEEQVGVVTMAEKRGKGKVKQVMSGDAFKCDSLDGNKEGSREIDQNNAQNDTSAEKCGAVEKSVSLGQGKLWTEPFFYGADDYRLQEGVDFVKRMFGMNDDGDFSKTRQALKKVVKRKVMTFQKKKEMFKKKLGSSARKRQKRVSNALKRKQHGQ